MRIGYGWDSHEFKKGVPLWIGGIRLDHDRGLAGHSDGDVLLHALTDALLGAIAAGDIGSFFPPTDPKWKGADSALFVAVAVEKIKEHGYEVNNVDSTLILSAPKIGPVASKIQARVAQLLGIAPNQVGIKAKTPEGMGTEDAAIAHVIVLLEKHEEHQLLEMAAAVLEAEHHVNETVKNLISDVELPAEPLPERPAKKKVKT